MLGMRESLEKTRFSDESRVVLGDDKGWRWSGNDGDNQETSASCIKCSPSVIVFAVIGIGFKSNLTFAEGSIETDCYIHNLDRVRLIDPLDEMHGTFGWIMRQDAAPAPTSQAALD
jgi:hypothetical protein